MLSLPLSGSELTLVLKKKESPKTIELDFKQTTKQSSQNPTLSGILTVTISSYGKKYPLDLLIGPEPLIKGENKIHYALSVVEPIKESTLFWDSRKTRDLELSLPPEAFAEKEGERFAQLNLFVTPEKKEYKGYTGTIRCEAKARM